jgi:prepilin-type N-terminal cleavage/methylation domain-containing protein
VEDVTTTNTPQTRHPVRRDGGVTLIEILITIVLLGLVVVGILTATRTLVLASRTADEVAQVQTALLTAAERIDRAPREQYLCVFDDPIRAAAQLELGVTEDVVDNYWSVQYEHLGPSGWTSGACPATGYQQHLVQRITITMTIPDSSVSRSLVVVKADV